MLKKINGIRFLGIQHGLENKTFAKQKNIYIYIYIKTEEDHEGGHL